MFTPNLDHLRPTAKHYEHVLHGVHIPVDNPKPVTLFLAFCGRGSRYWNALLKWKPIADEVEATRRSANALAELGVIGWKHVEHDGTPVPYNPEDCQKVFDALLAANRLEIVDRALAAAMNPDNFTETPLPTAADLGKQ